MPRPQITLKTLLWLMAVAGLVAHSFWQRERHMQEVNALRLELREWKIRQQMTAAELSVATGIPDGQPTSP